MSAHIDIHNNLDKKIIGILQNGIIYDLQQINNLEQQNCKPIYLGDALGLQIIRHSFAHVLAQALKRLYVDISFYTGPITDSGFFYDILIDQHISATDLPKIQKEMQKIINENIPIIRKKITKDEFKQIFNDKVKTFVFNKLQEPIFIYEQKEFIDLCKGPHVMNTGILNPDAFELHKVSGVHVGEFNLQRIEGIAFYTKDDIKHYKHELETSKQNDHRIVGSHLFFNSELSTGCVFWSKYGVILFRIIEEFIRKSYKDDYQEIKTPPMLKEELWKLTGHMDEYSDNMFIHKDCVFKPMNCPAHVIFFKNNNVSYKQLPIRLAEFGCCFRREEHGGLVGLKRLRYFTQDDAHIFCTEDQIKSEIKKFTEFALDIYNTFGFNHILIKIATRPEKYIGAIELWHKAEKMLQDAIKSLDLDFLIAEADGAFYGPKVEFHLKDNLGKYWQCGTIQLDFGLTKRLDATYIDCNGDKQHPIVLHRAAIGTIERFIGVLLEAYKGYLPSWLNPLQCIILPISDGYITYAQKVFQILKSKNIRVEINKQNHTLNKKLKMAINLKPSAIVIIGDKEVKNNSLTIRIKNDNKIMSIDELINFLDQ